MENLLTAEEAVELSGFESELLLIDKEMREQAGKSLRFVYLRDGVLKSHLDGICEDLRHRGFRVEQQSNPHAIKVSW